MSKPSQSSPKKAAVQPESTPHAQDLLGGLQAFCMERMTLKGAEFLMLQNTFAALREALPAKPAQ